jgi:hypothetical protein
VTQLKNIPRKKKKLRNNMQCDTSQQSATEYGGANNQTATRHNERKRKMTLGIIELIYERQADAGRNCNSHEEIVGDLEDTIVWIARIQDAAIKAQVALREKLRHAKIDKKEYEEYEKEMDNE